MPDSGGFPVFDSSGRMLGNMTGNFGQVPGSLPALPDVPSLPAVGGAAGSPLPAIAASAGITGGATPPVSTTGTAATGPSSNWFARGVVVILGFVFVAVGLSQFGRGQNVIRAVLNKKV